MLRLSLSMDTKPASFLVSTTLLESFIFQWVRNFPVSVIPQTPFSFSGWGLLQKQTHNKTKNPPQQEPYL